MCSAIETDNRVAKSIAACCLKLLCYIEIISKIASVTFIKSTI